MKEFNRFRELREENNLTIEEISEIIGFPPEEYLKLKTSDEAIDLDALCAVADYHDVSEDYLFGRIDIRKPDYKKIQELIDKNEIGIPN